MESELKQQSKERKPWSTGKKVTVSVVSILAAALVAVLIVGNVVWYWWLYFYIDYKRIDFLVSNRQAEMGHVVFVGDSITDGCDLSRYYPELDAYNRGIAGATSSDLLHHSYFAIYDLKPSVVVLLIGTNDYQRSRTHLNADILANYRTLFDEMSEMVPDTKVLVQSVYPISDVSFHKHYRYGHGHVEELNAGIAALAAEYGYTYADVYSVLTVGDEEMNPDYSDDGLHPNDQGYRVISAYLMPIIQSLM